LNLQNPMIKLMLTVHNISKNLIIIAFNKIIMKIILIKKMKNKNLDLIESRLKIKIMKEY
jgi:hypothetical protein